MYPRANGSNHSGRFPDDYFLDFGGYLLDFRHALAELELTCKYQKLICHTLLVNPRAKLE
jgi:hypothetical protein